jgi:hypothetical protein
MTPDSIQDGLAVVAESVTRALADIAAANTPAIALHASDLMIRIAMSFVLSTLGPTVARRELAGVARDLEVEIAALNGGGETIN